jgi:hypothetical protein
MRLLREVTEEIQGPVTPEGGWNVGHLAHHGILISCDGFSMKLDLDQLNALFDLAEDGQDGEVYDHDDNPVFVEIGDGTIVLSREGDKAYPTGVVLDQTTLKEMGIEEHEAEQPIEGAEGPGQDDTIDPEAVDVEAAEPEVELEEGVKRAFRRSGKKIKRGFRVTSGWRKGRVVSNIKNAYKPRPKARTRLKLRIASKKKRIIRLLKGRITRRKPLSKRLVAYNKRISHKK